MTGATRPRRSSIIENPFAEVIAKAIVEETASEARPSRSPLSEVKPRETAIGTVSTAKVRRIKGGQVDRARKSRASDAASELAETKRRLQQHREEELSTLREKCEALTLENHALCVAAHLRTH